jgi:hypothetical protein
MLILCTVKVQLYCMFVYVFSNIISSVKLQHDESPDFKRTQKQLWYNLRYHLSICLESLKKTLVRIASLQAYI